MTDVEKNEPDELLDGETSAEDDVTPTVSYDVSSYGSDPEVEVLVSRLRRGDIIIPPFQRDYVWRQPEASKFIESLLLGLPVPGVFFATDPSTNKQLVIDGQQRLKTLRFFFDGYFNPRPDDKTQKVFSLVKVQKQFDGKTYKTLEEIDRIRLQTSIIHATVVKQNAPLGDDTSLYHIFERLNSGGRRLTDQEMRLALYHGPLIDKLKVLNDYPSWRKIFGKINARLKDQELILRFFAMLKNRHRYERPMGEFLNKYAAANRNLGSTELDELGSIFTRTIDVFDSALTARPFRLTTSLNVAVYDSCMVGLATRLIAEGKPEPDGSNVRSAYAALMGNQDYLEKVSRSTADDAFVRKRMELAVDHFREC
ncbi:MAG: DUF262 domain-containing protein [Candidatus Accumulibacter sp.]|uniref:GmrSD restriction endonucleases N-terminal domain-containing protein n=1 Tax=Candidatus Accumulibacter phosphatis TaxID=327160 RepID=A0A5S4EPR2_9PROT|nr:MULTISPECIES: DUF262 domain-containing protein [Candidatus Accumulibacter]MBO3711986.1 DUF262 domain-containing protein [Accumulibacter sp.]TMQ77450.1 hypothetical protein ACCUM_3061 [Candidatus Accumulibacter phosphatis]